MPTLSTALLAALKVLIFEATGQEDIPVRCQFAARTRPEAEGVVGLLRRMTILRHRPVRRADLPPTSASSTRSDD